MDADLKELPDLPELHRLLAGRRLRRGLLRLEMEPLVDNGHSVPVAVALEAPPPARLTLFSERNPIALLAHFSFGPLAGKVEVSTRIRLATSQRVVAVAELPDGSVAVDVMPVVVTASACVDGS